MVEEWGAKMDGGMGKHMSLVIKNGGEWIINIVYDIHVKHIL